MIQPKYFSFNHETAISNIFQKKINFEDVKDKAINEWSNLKQILEDNYFEIVELVPSPKSPDGLFPNWFMTHKNRYDLFSMEAQNRRHEINTESLFILNKKHELNLDFRKFSSEKKFLESTSSLVLDRINHIAYCALSSRSDINLAKKWCDEYKYKLISFTTTLANKPIYHTNVLIWIGHHIAGIGNELITSSNIKNIFRNLGNRKILKFNSKQIINFCGNMIELENKKGLRCLLMSKRAHHHLLQDQLQVINKSIDKKIIVDLDIIEKIGGGSVRCLIQEIY